MSTYKLRIPKIQKEMIFMSICIALANLSYIPYLNTIIPIDDLVKLLWFIFFIYCIINNGKISKNISKYIIVLLIFDIFIFMISILNKNDYFISRLFLPINMSVFFIVVGDFVGQRVKYNNDFIILEKTYIISSVFVLLIVYFSYYRGNNWLNSMNTIVVQKNSIACLPLLSFIILVFNDNLFKKNTRLIFLIFTSAMIIILKSRTVIISYFCILLYIWIKKSKKEKIIYLIVFFLLFSIVYFKTDFIDILINNILLNNRDVSINTVTSGRMTHFYIFENQFPQNWLIGTGGTYLESMPLALLLSYGILGSMPVIILLILSCRDIFTINSKCVPANLKLILISFFMVFILNSISEELAPFGPGVKCFLLWLFLGISLGYENIVKKEKM